MRAEAEPILIRSAPPPVPIRISSPAVPVPRLIFLFVAVAPILMSLVPPVILIVGLVVIFPISIPSALFLVLIVR